MIMAGVRLRTVVAGPESDPHRYPSALAPPAPIPSPGLRPIGGAGTSGGAEE